KSPSRCSSRSSNLSHFPVMLCWIHFAAPAPPLLPLAITAADSSVSKSTHRTLMPHAAEYTWRLPTELHKTHWPTDGPTRNHGARTGNLQGRLPSDRDRPQRRIDFSFRALLRPSESSRSESHFRFRILRAIVDV